MGMNKRIGSITFFVSLLIIFSFGYYYFKNNKELFDVNSNIQFMSKDETAHFIYTDPDLYMSNLSPTDLYARKYQSIDDYIMNSAKSAVSFTEKEQNALINAANKADRFFNSVNISEINCKKIAEIQWVFALTKTPTYENGLPHTRGSIIFLSSVTNFKDITELTKLLIHEKIHLYQRIYPEEVGVYLENHGFTKWKLRTGIPRIRANPDLDPWIYYDETNKKEMASYYNSDTPYAIEDATSTGSLEHPNEMIAYKISQMYS